MWSFPPVKLQAIDSNIGRKQARMWSFPSVMFQAIASESRTENRLSQGDLIHPLTHGFGLDPFLATCETQISLSSLSM